MSDVHAAQRAQRLVSFSEVSFIQHHYYRC